jgi:UDP-2,3-diacylglucosamine pyrophosphatase LpxH
MTLPQQPGYGPVTFCELSRFYLSARPEIGAMSGQRTITVTPEAEPVKPTHHRAVWISDVHLGTKHAQVSALLDFLRQHECEQLYLVGDLIDGWELRHKWYWRDEYNVLIQKLLRKSRKETRITYITGNHDEFVEQFLGLRFGRVTLARQAIHTGLDGRRYLVIHGHQGDGVMHFNRLLDRVGSRIYQHLLDLNLYFNRVRRRLGFGYWSLSAYLKFKAKRAVKYVNDYEVALAQMARRQKLDGVICGHIHRAEIKRVEGVQYLNCGDWVESCTALVEDLDGTIRLIHFHENNVLHSGGGPGTPDPGDGRPGDGGETRPSGGRRRRRREPETALAGLFPEFDAGAGGHRADD